MSADLLARRTARGATALRGGAPWRPTPCQVFGGLFWLVLCLASWRVPMCCDFGRHAAAVERLRASLLRPAHPTADLPGAGSLSYSPYTVAQGAFARLTGLAGWEVVRLWAPLNLLVLLTGTGRFVRVLAPRRPWAPVLALCAMVLLWGTERAWWSGWLGLMSLAGNVSRPATFAVGLTFWAWALTGTRASGLGGRVRYVGPSGLRGVGGYAALGVLYGLVLLVDPATAVGAALGAVAFVAGWQRGWRPAVAVRWALTGVTALLVARCWPYFDVFARASGHGADATHRQLYAGMAGHVWLALLGVPALWLRARRARRFGCDPLVLLFALECLAVAYGPICGDYAYGGLLGLALVAPQCALAVELAAPRPWAPGRRLLGWAAAGGACLGLLTAQAGAVVPRSLDPVGFAQPPRWPSYDWAARRIRPGEVVIADGYYAVRLIAGYGPNLAAPAWPDASLDERERQRRLADVRAYLDPASTRAVRTAVVRRYHVRWLLLTPRRRLPAEATVVAWSPRTGEVLARVRS